MAGSAVAGGFGGTFIYFGDPGTDDGQGPFYGGIGITALAVAGLIAGLVYCIKGEELDGTTRFVEQQITVGADLVGYQSQSQETEIPGQTDPIALRLPPATVADKTPPAPVPAREIVAVFDIKDDTGKLAPAVVVRLTTYLITILVQQGSLTAEKGASATAACSEEELVEALDQIAQQLSR